MKHRKLRIAVLASGHGSNLQALIDAIGAGHLDADLVGVFSDRVQAGALQRARNVGVPALAVAPSEFPNRLRFDEHLFSRIDAVHADVIVCAGYMRLISEREVAARLGRMINIHPSLLPSFKGLHTHQQAIAAGATMHGASVHFVSPELDGGPVIAQAHVPVLEGDDPGRLARRVLQREHPLLVATLRLLAGHRIELRGQLVVMNDRPLHTPLQLDSANRLVRPDSQENPQ
ncbi:MAG: phosphoribosylglycinamide formyltransferase [Pseudomonadota bacterium]|nr:phosphoribosylglycinamide formyltransferase [Pseudomonadota bacterium]